MSDFVHGIRVGSAKQAPSLQQRTVSLSDIMCLLNSSTVANKRPRILFASFPLLSFTGSKKKKRAGIPFCVDTKAAILSGLARLDSPTALLPDDLMARLLRDCNLDPGSTFVHAIYKRFEDLVHPMLRLAVRSGIIVDRRWTRERRTEGPAPSAFATRHPLTATDLGSDLPAGLARLMEGLQIGDLDASDTHAAAPTDLVLDHILATTGGVQSRSDSVGGLPARCRYPQHQRSFATSGTSFVHGLYIDDPAYNSWAEPVTCDAELEPEPQPGPQRPDVLAHLGRWDESSESSASPVSMSPAPDYGYQASPATSSAFVQHWRAPPASMPAPRMHPAPRRTFLPQVLEESLMSMPPAPLPQVWEYPPAPAPARTPYDDLLLEYSRQQERALDEEMDLLDELAGSMFCDE
ncbi:hypothetical protein LY76DRAFT_610923 [Colletotrichum caudatum]|nr:hypothetical protein LY76DRAFT_610923 [Colletotrichum caudatum]